MDFKNLSKVEYSDQLILTTEQLAEFYGCTTDNIKKNFNVNKERFIEGKHYFKLEGEELKKLRVTFGDLQISSMTRTLYLWTRKGAARHAKMLSTEKAWEVFELLEDNYFNSKEKIESAPQVEKALTVENQQPILKSTIAAIALNDAVSIKKNMEKYFGVKPGIAGATVISMVERLNDIELTEIKNLLPPAEHDIGYLTATQLGKLIAKEKNLKKFSAQKVNQVLLEAGLQEKEGDSGYKLTDKGKEYGEAIPFSNNKSGHAGYQIKWSAEVEKFFK